VADFVPTRCRPVTVSCYTWLMRCRRCHQSFDPSRSDARYCSDTCRVYASRDRDRIPHELRDRDRWLRHSANKVPLRSDGTGTASSTNPLTWSTFDDAAASRAGVGLGFALNGDGVICVDLDNAINDAGRIKPWAKKILLLMPDTYVEVSPSGKGLHVWGFGSVTLGRRWEYADGGVEIYGTGRYMTVTGKRVRGYSTMLTNLPHVAESLESLCQSVALPSPSNSTDARGHFSQYATVLALG